MIAGEFQNFLDDLTEDEVPEVVSIECRTENRMTFPWYDMAPKISLCRHCARFGFKSEGGINCSIAQDLYNLCANTGAHAPVLVCPEYKSK